MQGLRYLGKGAGNSDRKWPESGRLLSEDTVDRAYHLKYYRIFYQTMVY